MTVPGGYVSTAPLVVDDAVMIRSSATFDGTSPPVVRAYGENGTVRWVIETDSLSILANGLRRPWPASCSNMRRLRRISWAT